jgi:uncharacterized phage-associated protein
MTADREKLKSVIGYIAGRTSPGKVKLFKLMFLADFTARARHGAPITCEMYENFEMGPVPITLWRNFATITRECVDIERVDTGVIAEQRMTLKNGFVPKLTDDERRILDEIVDRFGQLSGNALRDFTHETIPYRATQRGATIPYGLAAYLEYRRPSRSHLETLLNDTDLMDTLRDAVRPRAA